MEYLFQVRPIMSTKVTGKARSIHTRARFAFNLTKPHVCNADTFDDELDLRTRAF